MLFAAQDRRERLKGGEAARSMNILNAPQRPWAPPGRETARSPLPPILTWSQSLRFI
jgi:hypothetical protein